MAEVLEAMGFPSEWCETALQSSSGLETAVDLLLQWQTNGVPQHFAQAAPNSAPESSSRDKEPMIQEQQINNESHPAGGAPTLRLGPLPGAASKSTASDASDRSPSSTLLPPSSGISSLEASSGVNHLSPSNSSCSDAVVPDALVEERKARYLAARRDKEEKEAMRERIRQQMREDMATRRFRQEIESPSPIDKGKSVTIAPEGESGGLERTSGRAPMVSNVELHIRCPWNQNLKGSFPASASLKDVRAYVVEQQGEQRSRGEGSQEHRHGFLRGENFRLRSGPVPFSGWSASIADSTSPEKLEAKELLKAARESHETRTRQIVASAKSLRDDQCGNSQSGDESRQATIYFLIPFPRKEFLTEAAMETTLAEAQLVPTGTLIVQHGPSEPDQQTENSRKEERCVTNYDGRHDRNTRNVGEGASAPPVYAVSEGIGPSDSGHCPMLNPTGEGGRALETEGERVRRREQALQAAAKRMSEAAKIFRAGLPLEVGETGHASHFPRDEENEEVKEIGMRSDASSIRDSVARPILQGAASVRRPNDGAEADADAELSIARNIRGGISTDPAEKVLDAPHLMAVRAAEQRLRNPQPLRAAEEVPCLDLEVSADEARSEEERVSRLQSRSRGRMAGVSELRHRPEKQQRTAIRSLPGYLVPIGGPLRSTFQQSQEGGSSSRRLSPSPTDAERRAESLKAALQRCTEANEGGNDERGPEEGAVLVHEAPSPSSPTVEQERTSTLRVRLEDGSVEPRTFPACTQLQFIRNSFTPDDAAFSDYGLVIPFPEPRFMEGDDLNVTLEDVGLVPRGIIHLMRVSLRGIVREGRGYSRRRRIPEYDDPFQEELLERWDRVMDEDFTYEDMLGLEESIGRVHVGVPDEMILTFPTRIVEEKTETSATNEGVEGEPKLSPEEPKGELDLCTICMSEMVPKEEVLSLPCLHTYHSLCIKKWLRQSTICPTCKRSVV